MRFTVDDENSTIRTRAGDEFDQNDLCDAIEKFEEADVERGSREYIVANGIVVQDDGFTSDDDLYLYHADEVVAGPHGVDREDEVGTDEDHRANLSALKREIGTAFEAELLENNAVITVQQDDDERYEVGVDSSKFGILAGSSLGPSSEPPVNLIKVVEDRTFVNDDEVDLYAVVEPRE